jgi:hypothetical protein
MICDMRDFALHPFLEDRGLPQIEILGEIDRNDNLFSIDYQLLGDLDLISIPLPSAAPSRKFHLWEDTCFELFIGVPGDRNYWEFNLSPAGDWNVFHLDDYRQGLRDETAFTSLPFQIDRQPNSVKLNLAFDLSKIISPDRKLEIGITTVIRSTENEFSYWALTHPGQAADFHLRDSLIVKL